ncbi:MAG: protein-glutamate O-methyltransferase CheR [Terracidiphilus sp.]
MAASVFDNSLFPMGLREFKMFRTLIHRHTGIWLRDGKQIMLASRLSRRLRHHGIASFAEYYEYVQREPGNSVEIRELINCVTTNKTSFFREPHHFQFLANTVVPQIQSAARQGTSRRIRIWSAACSTGEEPYSIAITLLEALQASQSARTQPVAKPGPIRRALPELSVVPGSWTIEIVASDIDTNVLGIAALGMYSIDSLAGVDASFKKKYFLRGKDDMQGKAKVKPDVARLVQFKRINLQDARWPLEGSFDVIFFRNALIYFNQKTQDAFLRKMACFLNPNGYLFLGNSEHIPWLQDIFSPLNQTMYRLRDEKK